MSRRVALRFAFLLVVVGALVMPAGAASAHPLGNFTINTYSGLRVGVERIDVEFLIDMAEIPTLQRKREVDQPGYAERECGRALGQMELRVDDVPVPLRRDANGASFPKGQGGLRTLRLSCAFSAPTSELRGDRSVSFSSGVFADRAGWREITAVGDRTTLQTSNVPDASISKRLTSYPEDLLGSPVDQRSAALIVVPGGPVAGDSDSLNSTGASRQPRGVDRATQAFTSFVARQDLTVGFAFLAVGASVVLGAIHALAPGHGKTVMAAYLVGQRGSFRQAMVIALTVTATHTAGVLALGIAISASSVVAPERVYPWLGTAGGVLLALVGFGVLIRTVRLRRAAAAHRHDHYHDHDHDHHHHDDDASTPSHSHGGRRHSHGPLGDDQLVTWKGLVAMGFVGGLLPSPSAVVVLLGATALGRAWFGVLLVVVYGLGMAATLTGAGLLLLRARGALDNRVATLRQNRLLVATSRVLPAVTGGFIVAVGLYLAARGAAQI